MSIKEKLLNVIETCEEKDLQKIWVGLPLELKNKFKSEENSVKIKDLQKLSFKAYVFDEEKNCIIEEDPDDFDLQMLNDIENNQDCKEFISQEDALEQLGINTFKGGN